MIFQLGNVGRHSLDRHTFTVCVRGLVRPGWKAQSNPSDHEVINSPYGGNLRGGCAMASTSGGFLGCSEHERESYIYVQDRSNGGRSLMQ